MPTYRELFGNDCLANLDLARCLRDRAGEQLADERIRGAVLRHKGLSEELARHMGAMGLGRLCSSCAVRPGGGCCSRAFADENDVMLLLMNLMGGVEVTVCQDNGDDCCFLGKRGCIMLFKPFFCLNYDCAAIKTACSALDLSVYERLRTQLLMDQWRLELLLLERLEEMGLVSRQ